MDHSFAPTAAELDHAVHLLHVSHSHPKPLPEACPISGLGEEETLNLLAAHVLGRAAFLDKKQSLAHMDPPTPWITWATAMWNARLNQNLLHPATAPFAISAEDLVLSWLAPAFGMSGGHFCSGSTVSNLTAIWAARDSRRVKKVVASSAAHLSIRKAAHILGLEYEEIPTTQDGKIDASQLTDLSSACLVLTAGTTATGAIDALELARHSSAKWTHVDAAWAGPLRLSPTHAPLLDGIEHADSVAVSAHKWLFQPKDSAMVLFRDVEAAHASISFGGGYLAKPNVGVQGSRGASAIPLLATLMAWGKDGLAERIDRTMGMSTALFEGLRQLENDIEVWAPPTTGVTVFRPRDCSTTDLHARLPEGMFSLCNLDEQTWLRSVAANPNEIGRAHV